MSGKGPGVIAVITSTVNVHVYIEIVDTFLILSFESRFGDEDVFPSIRIIIYHTALINN